MRYFAFTCFAIFFGVAEHGSSQAMVQTSDGDLFRHSSPSTIQIEYHKFLLLRLNDKLTAIHAMPDPRFGLDSINYRWYQLSDNSDNFFDRTTPRIKTGSGSVDEGKLGSGWMKVAGHKIEWSKSDFNNGWIYLHDLDESIEVYPEQFVRLQDFSGKLDDSLWKPVMKLKSEYKGPIQPFNSVQLEPGKAVIDGIVVPFNFLDKN